MILEGTTVNNLDFVIGFFNTFNPEPCKYVERDPSGQMRTVRANLTVELVFDSFNQDSLKTISFFAVKGKIDYFGIDIDDHASNGWIKNRPTAILEERFNLVCNKIGESPNLIFKSPRGIHAYWFFEQSVPNLILYNRLNALFKNMKHIEILPTNRHSLRIPSKDACLNNNLENCNFAGFESLIRYPNDTIFKNGFCKKEYSTPNKKDRKASKEYHISFSLEQLEYKMLPLKNGQTNAVYLKLVAMYKIHGLDVNLAYERFVNLVNRSPGYNRRLLIDLENRIKTSYKRMADINLSQMKPLSDLYREPQVKLSIDSLVKRMGLDIPKKNRMRKSMKEFLLNIISWKNACDKTFKNHETAYYWEYLYPRSWSRHKEGYYPLPSNLLRKWNRHYDRPLGLLKDFGVLKESPYRYSTTLKRCKYYRINIPSGSQEEINTKGIINGDRYYI
jgi:hypothetical protein